MPAPSPWPTSPVPLTVHELDHARIGEGPLAMLSSAEIVAPDEDLGQMFAP